MELRVNDIYKFRYKSVPHNIPYKLYVPYYGIVGVFRVTEDLILEDYWHQNKHTLEELLEKGDLNFVCNLDDVREIEIEDFVYYNPRDIFTVPRYVDEHKPPHQIMWLRKGAKKDRDYILRQLEVKVEIANERVKAVKKQLKEAEKIYKKASKEKDLDKIKIQ